MPEVEFSDDDYAFIEQMVAAGLAESIDDAVSQALDLLKADDLRAELDDCHDSLPDASLTDDD